MKNMKLMNPIETDDLYEAGKTDGVDERNENDKNDAANEIDEIVE